MERTQIYITKDEKTGLRELGRELGKGQSELIREAIDKLISESDESYRDAVLERTAGMWINRDDLPSYTELRSKWDRK